MHLLCRYGAMTFLDRIPGSCSGSRLTANTHVAICKVPRRRVLDNLGAVSRDDVASTHAEMPDTLKPAIMCRSVVREDLLLLRGLPEKNGFQDKRLPAVVVRLLPLEIPARHSGCRSALPWNQNSGLT